MCNVALVSLPTAKRPNVAKLGVVEKGDAAKKKGREAKLRNNEQRTSAPQTAAMHSKSGDMFSLGFCTPFYVLRNDVSIAPKVAFGLSKSDLPT